MSPPTTGVRDLPPETLAYIAGFLLRSQDKARLAMAAPFLRAASNAHGDAWWGASGEHQTQDVHGGQMASMAAWMRSRGFKKVPSVCCLSLSIDDTPFDVLADFVSLAAEFWPEVHCMRVEDYDNRFCRLDPFAKVRFLELSVPPRLATCALCPAMLPPALESLEICGDALPEPEQTVCDLRLPPSLTLLGLRHVKLAAPSLPSLAGLDVLKLSGARIEGEVDDLSWALWQGMHLEELELGYQENSDSEEDDPMHERVTKALGFPRCSKLAVCVEGGSGPFLFPDGILAMLGSLDRLTLLFEYSQMYLEHDVALTRDGTVMLDRKAYPNLEFRMQRFD